VARDVLAPLGPELVSACQVQPGQRVLDIAAGSGNAAIPAAEMGATVVASDLTPALLDAGRREAAARGVALDGVEADAETLPFEDGEFDVVMSCLGVMRPGISPPRWWGNTTHVRDLFGDRVEALRMSSCRSLRVDHFADPKHYCAYHKAHYGPTVAIYACIAAEPGRVAALDRDFLAYARRSNRAQFGSRAVYGYDYMVVTARKRAG
jgi:SAM-dependent methyltransferase